MFSNKDIQQIENKKLTVNDIYQQIGIFTRGVPYLNLKEAANVNSGILKILDDQKQEFVKLFDSKTKDLDIVKFVPASGAATRMFKFLFQFLEDYNPNDESVNAYINRNKANDMSLFLVGLEKFPFYKEVLNETKRTTLDYGALSVSEQVLAFIKTMLDEDKLNMSFYPKGLFPFHKYKDHNATAFEEHLFEAALYAASNGEADLHFTISEKHKDKFDKEFARIEEIVERKTNTAFNITFSYQKESTDTIAVTHKNEPFRNEDNSLLFRPSGHGALIKNLNEINADVIFVKNIDNVVVYKYETEVAAYKKMLAGVLLEVQEQAFKYLRLLDRDEIIDEQLLEIARFLTRKLNVVVHIEFEKYSHKYQIEYLRTKLDRPLRVCGMVKNEGEPGGGPFWVKNESGKVSLQIVESSQIDKKNKAQKSIMKNAAYFNPVDLVCGVKNYKGEKYDLLEFIDHKTVFISSKTKSGKELKALELPGLWNGSMANWNTIFVEVPLITFNPVKTVNDLLKAPHQIN
ncbi:MAG: DUF4301 family protein [Flavobacteriaceae bacterium]|nr:DUF4301 family protein [Flavobacteriaceae bacterium]